MESISPGPWSSSSSWLCPASLFWKYLAFFAVLLRQRRDWGLEGKCHSISVRFLREVNGMESYIVQVAYVNSCGRKNSEKCSSSALLVPQETSRSLALGRPIVKRLWKHARCRRRRGGGRERERETGNDEVNGKKFSVRRRRGRKVSPKELFIREKMQLHGADNYAQP